MRQTREVTVLVRRRKLSGKLTERVFSKNEPINLIKPKKEGEEYERETTGEIQA